MAEHQRRQSDKLPVDIGAMILDENDPKQRAFLIVLNAINNSLVANTTMTKDLSEKLELHLTVFAAHASTEEALMNKGRGAWRVVAWVVGAVQIIGLGIWSQARTELQDINKLAQVQHETVIRMEQRIFSLEQKR